MKNILKFVSMMLVVSGIASLSSCGPETTGNTAPAAPTDLKIENLKDASAVLTWTGTAEGYEVVVGESAAQTVTDTFYTAMDLVTGTTYTWKVRAKSGDLFSDWVNGPEFTTTGVTAPSGLTVSGVTDVAATFAWEGATESYELIIGEAEAMPLDAKTFTATELTPETSYTWKVRAKDGDVYSQWIEGDAFSTPATVIYPPDAPTNLAVTDIDVTSAKLSWEGVTETYEVVINDAAPKTVNATTYIAAGLASKTAYTWKVRAIEGELASDWVEGEGFTTEDGDIPVGARVILYEPFDDCAGPQAPTSGTTYDAMQYTTPVPARLAEDGWSLGNNYGFWAAGLGCVRIGKLAPETHFVETPKLAAIGSTPTDVTLTFNAYAPTGVPTEIRVMVRTASNSLKEIRSITLPKSPSSTGYLVPEGTGLESQLYTVQITGLTSGDRIRFDSTSSSGERFFLDNVKVVAPEEE